MRIRVDEIFRGMIFVWLFFFSFRRRNISWHNKNTYIRPYLAYTGPHEQLCVTRYLVHECERLTFLCLFFLLSLCFFFFEKDRCTGFKLQKLLLRSLHGCRNVQFLKKEYSVFMKMKIFSRFLFFNV